MCFSLQEKIKLNRTKNELELDYFFVSQTTHHVYEALWQRRDTDYTDVQDRPVPLASYSHGQTHIQRSSKCYSR